VTLSAGARLGPYEILAPLGAGGMGEVYRAKDPRLDREVAVKVLPASFAADPERLRRFEQEAKAAGSLNHPNIMAVYDAGSHDGAPYVVSELLEGETLRAALAGGPVSARRVIDYATQVARGLAAAHEKGIVHRDLKPENLFVTRDGRVKVLDFGLAKLTRPESGAGPLTEAPTATAGTEPGIVLGTIGYMSPEQVRGQPADARSDIFTLGAILHEMLSGKRAFRGETAADTMSAILREDPPDLSLTNQNVPPGLERVIRHCLEKNPEQRFQSARDLAFDLEALSGLSAPRLEALSPRAQRRLPSVAAVAALVAAVAAGVIGGHLAWKGSPAPSPSYRVLTFRRGPVWSARFAPDGQTIIYAASWGGAQKSELYSVRAESPESLRLALPPGQIESISRGGEMLLLNLPLDFSVGWARSGTLSQAPLSGSAARDLLEDIGNADWSPDGSALAVVRAPQHHYRLEFPVGKVLYETAGWISHPRVSPRGDSVAFLDHPAMGDDLGSLAIVDRSGTKRIVSGGWSSAQGVAWSADGQEIWFTAARAGSARALYAVTPSGRRRSVATIPGTMTLQDIARDGRVLFVHETEREGVFGLLPGEAQERDLSGLDFSNGPTLSPDAKAIVFTEQGEGGGLGYSVYLRKLDGSPAVRLGEGLALAVSPDGKWVLASLVRSTPAQIVLLPTGAGETKAFPKDSINHESAQTSAAFLPDGKRILFVGNLSGRPPRVFLQNLSGGPAVPVTSEGVEGFALSLDGKSLVARTREGKFFLAPVEGGPSRPIRGLEAADWPIQWASDGRSLFVRRTVTELPARVYRVDMETGRREVWKEFMPGDPAGINAIAPFSISPDGQTIVFEYDRTLSELYLAEGMK
jgi:serine/threonine protein kinase/Tol biopolymer transport system component